MTRKERQVEICYRQLQRARARRFEIEFDAAARQRTVNAIQGQRTLKPVEEAPYVGEPRSFEPTPPAQFIPDYFERIQRGPSPIQKMGTK